MVFMAPPIAIRFVGITVDPLWVCMLLTSLSLSTLGALGACCACMGHIDTHTVLVDALASQADADTDGVSLHFNNHNTAPLHCKAVDQS